MSRFERTVGARASAFAVVLLLASVAPSAAQDASGLWANQLDACDTIFLRDGNRVSFSPTADFHGSGFIIEGNVIRGKSATCKVRKKARKGDVVTITATCASDVMVGDATFQLKVADPNSIVKIVPGIPELDTKYFRCPSN